VFKFFSELEYTSPGEQIALLCAYQDRVSHPLPFVLLHTPDKDIIVTIMEITAPAIDDDGSCGDTE